MGPVAVQPQISSRGRRPSGSYSTTQRKSASIPSRLLPLVSGTHAATKTRSRRRRRRRIRVRCRGHTRLIHPEFTASLLRPGAESQQQWRPPLLPTIFLHDTQHTLCALADPRPGPATQCVAIDFFKVIFVFLIRCVGFLP